MDTAYQDFYREILMDKATGFTEKADKLLTSLAVYTDRDKDQLLSNAVEYLLWDKEFARVIYYCTEYTATVTTPQYHAELYRYWIQALEKTNRWEDAIELRRKVMIELNGNSMYEDVAEAYEEAGDWDNALLYYDKHLKEENGWLETDDMAKIAKKYEERGDLTNSARYWQIAAVKACNEHEYLWENTGRALALAGKHDEALKYFAIALILEPNDENVLYSMGQVYQDKEDNYMAMHYYTEVLKINPTNPMVYNNLGAMAFNDDGDIKESIEKIEAALEMEPSSQLKLTMHINLARLYDKISDYDKHNYHKSKIFEAAGFGSFTAEEDDEDTEGLEDNMDE